MVSKHVVEAVSCVYFILLILLLKLFQRQATTMQLNYRLYTLKGSRVHCETCTDPVAMHC